MFSEVEGRVSAPHWLDAALVQQLKGDEGVHHFRARMGLEPGSLSITPKTERELQLSSKGKEMLRGKGRIRLAAHEDGLRCGAEGIGTLSASHDLLQLAAEAIQGHQTILADKGFEVFRFEVLDFLAELVCVLQYRGR
ncbi:hypothetical protein DPQ33_18160 [Oceanidesulfovibrio indonesiensis]|uniref:Uncharacterized protein n=1 Tax=Oceanidesulfovibrio indonesiensis TaxID=54767 RepID=A0A7M3M9V8_9BACT|nr:hypothetical protein DPQ33_18160 [Oceanidesulfovibrio indonesiensis]